LGLIKNEEHLFGTRFFLANFQIDFKVSGDAIIKNGLKLVTAPSAVINLRKDEHAGL
jgi:hypothetical protein